MCPGNLEVVRKPQLSPPVAVVLFLTIIAGGPVRLRLRVRVRRLRDVLRRRVRLRVRRLRDVRWRWRVRLMNLLLGVVLRLRMGRGELGVLVYFSLRRSWPLLFRHCRFAFRRFFVSHRFHVFGLPDLSVLFLRLLRLELLLF